MRQNGYHQRTPVTLHNDFGIDLTQEGEGDLAVMCNLGEGIYEDGLMKGSKKDGKKAENL